MGLLAALWPLVLLTPFVPGLPRPALSGPPWRQELALSALLALTLALVARRAARSGVWTLQTRRAELCLLLPLALFALWGAASAAWAASPHPAFHYGLTWGAYLLFFALVRRAAGRPRLLRASVATLLAVTLVVSAASLIGASHGRDFQVGYNGLGEPSAIAAPFFAALALAVRRRGAALLCGAAALLSWATVLHNGERAPFVAALASLVVLSLLMTAVRRFRPRGLKRAGALAAAFALALALHSLPSPLDAGPEAKPSVVARLRATSATEANTSARLLFWGVGLEMLRAHPFQGVGAANYDAAFAEARVRFSERHAASDLVALNEGFLTQSAHNEYVQMLAELGVFGFSLFVLFGLMLVRAAFHALRHSGSMLAPACFAGMVAFALSSGASSISFRWMGSGLLFFFLAAVITRLAEREDPRAEADIRFAPATARRTAFAACAFACVAVAGVGAQGASVLLHGAAQAAGGPARAESLYNAALFWNPFDAATRYSFGMWLSARGRDREAVPHLRFAAERGFNSSVCYAYLVAAEAGAGDQEEAEKTLAKAVRVYPRSVFLRVRHAAALRELGREEEADGEFAAALAVDAGAARGWREMISNGAKAAARAARQDPGVTLPGHLQPEACVFAVIAEQKKRGQFASADF